jgi:anti-sigma factor RsiW
MTSRHSRLWHGEYLEGEVSPERKAEIEQHLQGCPECREDLERLRRLRAFLERIESPDPGGAYFDGLGERITARIDSSSVADDFPQPVRPGNRSGEILKTLIGLAAVITLLFSSFYLSGLKQEKDRKRWAEKASQGRYVQTETGESTPVPAELQTGINSVGSPSPLSADRDSLGVAGSQRDQGDPHQK